MYNLEQKLNATRQELSYALYSQDAASRVIARLLRERDAAREYVYIENFNHRNELTVPPELLETFRRQWALNLLLQQLPKTSK